MDIETLKKEAQDIPGYEGNYQITRDGTVLSVERYVRDGRGERRVGGRILKAYVDHRGYMRIMLSISGTTKKHFIHQLVAKTYIPNPLNHKIINHKDGNPRNNNVVNIEWCTYGDNEKHSYRVLGKKPNRSWKGKTGVDHIASKPVLKYSKEGKLIARYCSLKEAADKNNTLLGSISAVVCGRRKTHHGCLCQLETLK